MLNSSSRAMTILHRAIKPTVQRSFASLRFVFYRKDAKIAEDTKENVRLLT